MYTIYTFLYTDVIDVEHCTGRSRRQWHSVEISNCTEQKYIQHYSLEETDYKSIWSVDLNPYCPIPTLMRCSLA